MMLHLCVLKYLLYIYNLVDLDVVHDVENYETIL